MSVTHLILLIAIILVLAFFWLILRLRRARRGSVQPQAAEYVNNQVYVGNLPYRVNENDLKKHFSSYGHVQQARIVKNKNSGRSKGFGFVTFSDVAEANAALVAHGDDFSGRSIVVRIAKPRE